MSGYVMFSIQMIAKQLDTLALLLV